MSNEVTEILEDLKNEIAGEKGDRYGNSETIDVMERCQALLQSHAVIEELTAIEITEVLLIESQDFEKDIMQAELDRIAASRLSTKEEVK